MTRKLRKVTALIILIVLLLSASPVFAGGWIVVTLDALPGPVYAGESFTVGFMVRQHGVKPTGDVSPVLRAVNSRTGDTYTVDARPAGETGHFEARVTLPAEGEWEWQISAPPYPQEFELPSLTVMPAVPAAAAATVPANGFQLTFLLAGVAFLGLAGVLLLLERRRQTTSAPVSAA